MYKKGMFLFDLFFLTDAEDIVNISYVEKYESVSIFFFCFSANKNKKKNNQKEKKETTQTSSNQKDQNGTVKSAM